MVLICLVTSKGAAGVVGSAFIVLAPWDKTARRPLRLGRAYPTGLAATLASLKTIPVEGMVLILGVDRLMAEARSVTNLIGNGVATILLAKWEGEFDMVTAEKMLRAGPPATGKTVLVRPPETLAADAVEEWESRSK